MGSSHIFTASQSFRKCHFFVHLRSCDLSTCLMCHHYCTSSATLYQDRIPADRVREISDDSLSSFIFKHGLNPRLLPRPRQSTVCASLYYTSVLELFAFHYRSRRQDIGSQQRPGARIDVSRNISAMLASGGEALLSRQDNSVESLHHLIFNEYAVPKLSP